MNLGEYLRKRNFSIKFFIVLSIITKVHLMQSSKQRKEGLPFEVWRFMEWEPRKLACWATTV